jgi:hypothetical protein
MSRLKIIACILLLACVSHAEPNTSGGPRARGHGIYPSGATTGCIPASIIFRSDGTEAPFLIGPGAFVFNGWISTESDMTTEADNTDLSDCFENTTDSNPASNFEISYTCDDEYYIVEMDFAGSQTTAPRAQIRAEIAYNDDGASAAFDIGDIWAAGGNYHSKHIENGTHEIQQTTLIRELVEDDTFIGILFQWSEDGVATSTFNPQYAMLRFTRDCSRSP